jgi:hypothetical protein
MIPSYIPRKDADFAQWVSNFMNYLSVHQAQFNFPATVFSELTVLQAAWDAAYAAAETVATRTKATVVAKEEARATLEKELRRDIREFLTYSRFVSDADRKNMGLPVHKTGSTPTPPPAETVKATVSTPAPATIAIDFRSEAGRAKPAGVHGAEIVWAILDRPPVNWSELIHSNFDTRSPFTLSFEGEDRGKHVYIALRWENTKGEKGPWCDIISAIIP